MLGGAFGPALNALPPCFRWNSPAPSALSPSRRSRETTRGWSPRWRGTWTHTTTTRRRGWSCARPTSRSAITSRRLSAWKSFCSSRPPTTSDISSTPRSSGPRPSPPSRSSARSSSSRLTMFEAFIAFSSWVLLLISLWFRLWFGFIQFRQYTSMSNSGDTSEKKQWEELKELTTDRLLASYKPAPEVIRRVIRKYLGKA